MLLANRNSEHNTSTLFSAFCNKLSLQCLWIRSLQLGAVACVMIYTVSLHSLANSHLPGEDHLPGKDDSALFSSSEQTPRVISAALSPAVSFVQSKTSAYAKELARVDRALNAKKAFAAAHPDSELHLTSVAEAYFERARLSGEFTDYADALKTLRQAFSIVDRGNGPVLLRARLNYSLHRLPAIESDLQTAQSALLVNKRTLAMVDGIRADVLLQQGKYADAMQAYEELNNRKPDSTGAIRIAQANAYIGNYEEAERWFSLAQVRAPRRSLQLKSWIALQTGILYFERGRLDEALVHYHHALDLFPGYWLVEEHIAEIDALQGRTEKAERSYRDLISRTGSPQFMIALADILLHRDESKKGEAFELLEKANQVFQTMATEIPEAIAGHSLEYFLHQGSPKQALQLAMDNYQLRPGGPHAVMLAQAHAVNGNMSEASQVLDKVLMTPYSSADLHATAKVVYQAQGFSNRADHHAQLAQAINPGALESSDWLWRSIKAPPQPKPQSSTHQVKED